MKKYIGAQVDLEILDKIDNKRSVERPIISRSKWLKKAINNFLEK